MRNGLRLNLANFAGANSQGHSDTITEAAWQCLPYQGQHNPGVSALAAWARAAEMLFTATTKTEIVEDSKNAGPKLVPCTSCDLAAGMNLVPCPADTLCLRDMHSAQKWPKQAENRH